MRSKTSTSAGKSRSPEPRLPGAGGVRRGPGPGDAEPAAAEWSRAERPPAVSAIVVAGPLRERAAACLDALLAEAAETRLEVILVDLAAHLEPVCGSSHGAVRVMPMPADTTFAAARAAAVGAARGAVVAFLEEHVRVRPGWARAVVAAHGDGWAGVGGEVHNANPGVGSSDVTALLGYGLFLHPLERGEAELLPGHNASYSREVLLAYGDRLERLLGCDLVLMRRLRLDGYRLGLEPAVAIGHLNETSPASSWRGYLLFNRCYAALRAAEFDWTPARRLAYIALTPAIPVYFIAHFARFLARRHPRALPLFLRNLPFVYLAELAAAIGQAAGLLLGEGDAPQRFSCYEITEPRLERTRVTT